MVVKSEYRTLIVTVRQTSRSSFEPCGAVTRHLVIADRIAVRLVRSCENVFSLPQDFAARSGTTGRSSSPGRAGAAIPPGCRRLRAARPRRRRAHRPGARCRVAESSRRDRSHATQRVDWQLLKKRSTRSGGMTVRPSGFFQAEAILARNLFGATPADAVSPVASRIRSFSLFATSWPRVRPSCSRSRPGTLRRARAVRRGALPRETSGRRRDRRVLVSCKVGWDDRQ